jgi:hypothetical protein
MAVIENVSHSHVPASRKPLVLMFFAVLVLAAVSSTFARQGKNGIGGERGDANTEYAIGLWGDVPYSDAQATVGVPNMIADMNTQKLAFSVNDGDLKQGSGNCDDALYTRSLNYLNALEAPAILTPGDNDWTDCDRNAGVSSLERLSHERKLFFSTPSTLGQRTFIQEVQSTPFCLGEKPDHTRFQEPCVENRRWTYGRVTYATLNVQGSCNNLCDVGPDPNEYAARNAANIVWLRETFAVAKGNDSVAVMLISQADPGFDGSDATRAPLRDPLTLVQSGAQPDGFKDFLVAVREQVIAFKKPVAYVHGDSHYFRVDRPMLDSLGRRLENFTRVETFGDNANGVTLSNDVQWVKAFVDPKSREVFSYQAQIVPGNRIAVPAP